MVRRDGSYLKDLVKSFVAGEPLSGHLQDDDDDDNDDDDDEEEQ